MHNNAGKQENALAWQVDVRPLDSSALILQGYPGGERNHFECYSKRWVQFPGKRYEWMVCICTDIKMWVPVRKALCTLTHPGKHTEMQNYEKVFSTDATRFVRNGLRSLFVFNTSRQKGERRTHRNTQTRNSAQRRGDERRDQTSVSLSLLSANHSKHLFMLDLYSTPPPPLSSIKHTALWVYTHLYNLDRLSFVLAHRPL